MLKNEIEKALREFGITYGMPSHIKSAEHMSEVTSIYVRELSKHFNDSNIDKAISLAWTKARKFPSISDFFEGYGGKEGGCDDSDILKGYDIS